MRSDGKFTRLTRIRVIQRKERTDRKDKDISNTCICTNLSTRSRHKTGETTFVRRDSPGN